MAKRKSVSFFFKCTNCGYTQPRWMGRCPDCGEWNTLAECTGEQLKSPFSASGEFRRRVQPLPLCTIDPIQDDRLFTGIEEFDRVLGGGAVKRSAVLIGGEPGIGKSTLLIQTAASMYKNSGALSDLNKKNTGGRILYVSGEEAAVQIRMRADRLELENTGIEILCTDRLEDIESALNALNPLCVIIDSIQTVVCMDAGTVAGTVNQLKYCATALTSWVKERDAVLFMSAHVTKDGNIAGPKALEHLVDTVISFEQNDDQIRFLRSLKNRFGSADELGIFSMGEKGLTAVEDPSALFIVNRSGSAPAGTAVVPVFEGSRVFLVEIQALTVPAKAALTRVYSDKIDNARISRVAAVLEKRIGLRFSDQDIYVNVAGGVRLTESAIDAALAAALYSARTDISPPSKTAIAGELSLAGEIRAVSRFKQRAKAAQTLGFTRCLGPGSGEDVVQICDIQSLVKTLFA